jgi:hypothetical protein
MKIFRLYHHANSPLLTGIEPAGIPFDVGRFRTYGHALQALLSGFSTETILTVEHDKHIPRRDLPRALQAVSPQNRLWRTGRVVLVLPYLIYPHSTGLEAPHIAHHRQEAGRWLWLDQSATWQRGEAQAVRVHSIGLGVVAWPPDAWRWIDPTWDYGPGNIDGRFSETFTALGGHLWCLRPWTYHWHEEGQA